MARSERRACAPAAVALISVVFVASACGTRVEDRTAGSPSAGARAVAPLPSAGRPVRPSTRWARLPGRFGGRSPVGVGGHGTRGLSAPGPVSTVAADRSRLPPGRPPECLHRLPRQQGAGIREAVDPCRAFLATKKSRRRRGTRRVGSISDGGRDSRNAQRPGCFNPHADRAGRGTLGPLDQREGRPQRASGPADPP